MTLVRCALVLLIGVAAIAGEAALPRELLGLPVLHQNRVKPFAVAADEVVHSITGRSQFGEVVVVGEGADEALTIADGSKRPAIETLLAWMRRPQEWHGKRLLYCPWLPLQKRLGLKGQWASLAELEVPEAAAFIRDARVKGWKVDLTPDEEKAIELGSRADEARAAFAGQAIGLAPLATDAAQRARVLAELGPLLVGAPAAADEADWRARLRLVLAEIERKRAGAVAAQAVGGATAAAQPAPSADAGADLLAQSDIWLTADDLAFTPDELVAAWPGPQEVALFAAAWGEAVTVGTDATSLHATTLGLDRALRSHVAPRVEHYPSERTIAIELAYRRARPFTWAWIAFLIGGICTAIGVAALGRAGPRIGADAVVGQPGAAVADPAVAKRANANGWTRVGTVATVIGILWTLAGLGVRLHITRFGAVTNLYETVVYVALLVAVLGLVFARLTRAPLYAVAGGVGAGLCAMVGEALPPDLGSNISQLQPVLRSQFWLWVHVKTIVASYAAFLLAMVLGNIVLAQAALRGGGVEPGISRALYRSLQVGVVLCAAGTLLGGMWADYAWGRFWGWDPKEVWALVILLTYLVPLHLRYVGIVGPTGLAAWSVYGFMSVIMSWYGVNFLLGAGLHAYAFGDGGQWIVLPLCAAQIVLTTVELVVIAVRRGRAEPAG